MPDLSDLSKPIIHRGERVSAIRTQQYLYIVNVRPDRMPLGDHYRLNGQKEPTIEELTEETRVTLPDEDAGPTKAWLVSVRNDPQWKSHLHWVYGSRPREELYDLTKDPYQTKNVAAEIDYASVRNELELRLMKTLQETGDPRLIEEGKFFETPPMAGPVNEPENTKKR